MIEESFPTHAILGEEFGRTARRSSLGDRSVDGTRPFICGVPSGARWSG